MAFDRGETDGERPAWDETRLLRSQQPEDDRETAVPVEEADLPAVPESAGHDLPWQDRRFVLVILNPRAGKCSGARNLSSVLMILQAGGYMPTVLQTESSGDARRFACELAGQYETIVCIGGDGTFSEVVAGVMDAQADIPVGYIPAGSTNDYAASLKLSPMMEQAAAELVEGEPRWLDAGLFNGRLFTYVASFGDFAKVSYGASQDLKNVLGHTAYILEGIGELPTLRAYHVRVETDDQVFEDDYLFGAVSNSTSIGGILRLDASDVSLDDGYLEILFIKSPATLRELVQMIQALSVQAYASCESITFCRSRRVRLWTDAEMPWTLDGEKAEGGDYAEIKVVPRAIQVLLPPDAHE